MSSAKKRGSAREIFRGDGLARRLEGKLSPDQPLQTQLSQPFSIRSEAQPSYRQTLRLMFTALGVKKPSRVGALILGAGEMNFALDPCSTSDGSRAFSQLRQILSPASQMSRLPQGPS